MSARKHDNQEKPAPLSRRDLLKYAAAGVALGSIGIARAAVREDLRPLPAALGHWVGVGAVTEFGSLRPGWSAPCASLRASDKPVLSPQMAQSAPRRGRAAHDLRLRILGWDGAPVFARVEVEVLHPVAALYATPAHAAFVVSANAGSVQQSTPIAMRVASAPHARPALKLQSVDADGVRYAREIELPTQAGVYPVAVAARSESLPQWHDWQLQAQAGGQWHRRLVDASGAAPREFGYLLLSVEQLA